MNNLFWHKSKLSQPEGREARSRTSLFQLGFPLALVLLHCMSIDCGAQDRATSMLRKVILKQQAAKSVELGRSQSIRLGLLSDPRVRHELKITKKESEKIDVLIEKANTSGDLPELSFDQLLTTKVQQSNPYAQLVDDARKILGESRTKRWQQIYRQYLLVVSPETLPQRTTSLTADEREKVSTALMAARMTLEGDRLEITYQHRVRILEDRLGKKIVADKLGKPYVTKND